MKSLSKDKVLRWVSGQQSQGGSGGGGGSVDLAGYATQIWTEQNYLSKEFFSSLFKAYDANGNEVLPNDTETVIDNIKAMFGFWTEQYVSALGQGSGGGGGGASALSDLLDVEINNPTNGQSLVYDSALSKWVNATGSGVDMDTVWRYLAQSSTQQIDISHLTTALSGYATQTWANGQFLKLTGGTLTGNLQVNAVVFGYNYTNSNNAAAFIFDKPGSNYTGIGANGVSDQIYFGACDGDGVWQNYLQKWYFNGSLIANGDITVKNGARISQTAETGSILYLGNANNYGWVRIQDMCSQDGNAGDDYWSIRIGGAAVFTSVYSKTYVTALSDARHKTIVSDAAISVEQIAKMPAVVYRWNDGREDEGLHVGSIAQNWQKVLPEVVMQANDDEGTLSMQYGVAALVSSIITARKVVDHERRIKELEEENKKLKMKLKIA